MEERAAQADVGWDCRRRAMDHQSYLRAYIGGTGRGFVVLRAARPGLEPEQKIANEIDAKVFTATPRRLRSSK